MTARVIRLEDRPIDCDKIERQIDRRAVVEAERIPLEREFWQLFREFESGAPLTVRSGRRKGQPLSDAWRSNRLWRLLEVHRREYELAQEFVRLERAIVAALYGRTETDR